jgi:recombination protein RecT
MSTELETTTKKAIAPIEKNITDSVLVKVNSFVEAKQLLLPKDYSAANALKSAYLLLVDTKTRDNKPVLEACTKESIANALFKMVALGLNPLKKQCNFIAYGTSLSCDMEYAGNIALAKRYGMKWIKGNAIMKGDEFDFEVDAETGRRKVIKHKQTLDSIGESNIIGAYAIYEMENGVIDTEIMNFKQIQAAWNQGAMKGNSPAHKNFADQMSIKTAINRACKLIIRTSDDAVLFDNDEEEKADVVSSNVKAKIETEANKKSLSISEEEVYTQHEVIDESPKTKEVQTEKSGELAEKEKAEISKEESDLFNSTKQNTKPNF